MVHLLKKGSGIHIKKSHEGRFTEYCGGNVTEECIRRGKNSPDPKIRKQAVFAQNARKFKHQDGGSIYGASQIQTNANLSQQWKQQQEIAAQNFNQGIEQKKYLDEMKRMQDMQKSQALGQSTGNTVGVIDGGQETTQTTTPQATAPQTTTQQWQPSFAGLSFQPTAPWQLYGKTPSMRDGGNFENIMNMNELFSTYKSVEPLQIEKEVEIPDFKSRYDSFLENLNRYKTKKKDNNELTEDNQNWFGNTSIAQVSSSMAPSSATNATQPTDYTSKDLQTMLQEQGLDKYITITSGYRDHNIGKAGSKSNHRKKNQHGLSMAYDIIPAQGETFDSIFQKIKGNPAIQQWLSQNGFNINDETNTKTLKRTGGTGAHFHIGPDKFNVRKAQYGLDVSSLFTKYNSAEIDKPTDKIIMPNQELVQQSYSPSAITNTSEKEKTEKQGSDQDWFNPETINASSSTKTSNNINSSNNMTSNTSFDQDFQKYGKNPIFANHKNFWRKLALSESSLNSQASNKSGAFGYFQIMPQSRTGADVASQFKDAEKLMTSHMSMINDEDRKLAQQKGITEEGLMAGVWLGGPGGVKRALRNKGDAKDSNGTSVMSYMKKFS